MMQNQDFSPSWLAGLVTWLRADLGVTSDVNGVSAWADQSGNGHNYAQATNANKPTLVASAVNGRPGIKGDADGKRFVTNASAPAFGSASTLVLVMTASSLASSYLNGVGAALIENFSATAVEWLNGSDRFTFASSLTAGAHILTVTQTDASSLVGYLDGAQAFSHVPASALSGAAIRDLVGRNGANNTDGYELEFMQFSRVLSTDELTELTSYLKSRYSIA